MSMSNFRSLKLCSVIACIVGVSACSTQEDAADISVLDTTPTYIPNIVPNNDLGDSTTEWTGWGTAVDDRNESEASFTLKSFAQSQGGNTLEVSVINVEAAPDEEADGEAGRDVSVGPVAVPVTPGQAYGVGAFVLGSRCGVANFVVTAADDPSIVLSEQEVFLTGGLQTVDYFFQVPETEEGAEAISAVDLPVQLSFVDNIGGEFYVDKIVAIPTAMPAPVPEGNVAINSNFEVSAVDINTPTGTTNTWESTTTEVAFTLNSEAENVQDGLNSVQVTFAMPLTGADPWTIEGGLVNVAVVDGWEYTFSAWIKGDAGTKANFIVQDPASYDTFGSGGEVTVTGDWQEVRFTAKVTGTSVVRLYAQYNFPENAGKTFYIDNVKLIPPNACPYAPVVANMVSDESNFFEYEHVVNGSLENSDAESTGWFTQAGDAAVAIFDVNQALSNTGSNALKATITTVGANSWDIQAGPADLEVTPGQSYIYSAWVRGAVGTKAKFTAAMQADPYTVFEEVEVSFMGLWEQVTFDFTVPSDMTSTMIRMPVHLSYAENEGERIFLDDFSLLPTNVSNGDLEGSETEALGWSWSSDVASFALTTTESHTGTRSLMANISDIGEDVNVWDVEVGMTDIAVKGGLKYYFSARVKGDSGAKVKLLAGLAADPYTEFTSVGGTIAEGETSPEGFELDGKWQEIFFEAVVPEGIESIRLMAHLGFVENSNKAVYLDSFRVVSQIPVEGNLVSLNEGILKANLVSNGGLESDAAAASGWSGYASTGEATFTVDSTEAHSGNNSYKVAVIAEADNTWEIEAGPDNLPVVPGNSYIFSAWLKGSSGSKANLGVSMQADPWTTFASQVVELDETWKQVTFELTIPADLDITHVRSRIQLSYAENVGAEIYIDDVSLIPTSVANGDLELSAETATGWAQNGGDYATFSVSQNEAHSGANSLAVDFSTIPDGGELNAWDIEAGISDIAVASGLTYHFSGRIKGANGMRVQFLMGMQSSPYDNFSSEIIDVSSGWQEVSFDVTIPLITVTDPDTDIDSIVNLALARVSVQMGYAENSDSTLYLDSFKVVPKAVLSNGDLEQSSTEATGWSPSGLTASISNTEAQSGLYSLSAVVGDVTAEANPWDSSAGLSGVPVLDGVTYKFTGWVKGEAGTTANLLLQLPVDPWSTFGAVSVEILDTEWQLVEFEAAIVAPDGVANLPVHLGYEQNSNATFYFDNFKLTPIGPNPVEEVVAE